jgi:hypothetical protein
MRREIIDFHAHLGKSWLAIEQEMTDAQELIKKYDEAGVAKACINSWNISYDPISGNDEIARVVKEYPDKFIGFGVISPRYRIAVQEVERCIIELGMKGIKMHPTCNMWCADSPVVYPVMEKIEELDVPVLLHTFHDDMSNPRRVAGLAEKFPAVKIVMAHMGGDDWLDASYIARDHKNVFMDTAEVVNETRIIREAVNIAGAEKLLFGTDSPGTVIQAEIAKITHGDISEEAKEMILAKNAKRLLGLK